MNLHKFFTITEVSHTYLNSCIDVLLAQATGNAPALLM